MEPPPDFDEDDLIDDYLDEGPGDEYDEYMEAMAAEAQVEKSQKDETTTTSGTTTQPMASSSSTTTTQPSSSQGGGGGAIQVIDSTTTEEMRRPSYGMNVDTDDDGNDDDMNETNVNGYFARQRTENNLYSFERFTSKTAWRSESSSPNTVVDNNNGNSNNTASSKAKKKLQQQQRRLDAIRSATSFTRTRKAPEARFMELTHQKNTTMSCLKLRQNNTNYGSKSSCSVLRSPVEGRLSQRITLADGGRVYIPIKKTKDDDKNNKSTPAAPDNDAGTATSTSSQITNTSSSSISLGVSMKELKRRSEWIMRRRAKPVVSSSSSSRDNDVEAGRLWVDKHAPSSFSHLLSDERTNREVLRALRAWDPFVFGRDPPVRPAIFRNAEAASDKAAPAETNNKHDKRPDEKNRVILLAGPPGVGKTTLAHIVARHAGYRPLEVNASDERSSSVLTDRVRRAMESTTINFNKNDPDHGRPNCLILDEIDGADAKGAVQALVDIIRAEIPPKGAKQQKSSSTYLRRPIIFICNHKYAPSLRPLLPFARHFNVDSPSPARLVARLKAVLCQEKMPMSATGSLLHQLVVASGGDIRSCMYTLQFASTEAKDSMEFSQALGTSLSGTGLKDQRNDVASTVTTVFRKPKAGRIAGYIDSDRVSVARVIDSAQGLGDTSALLNSIFTNLLNVPYIDPTLDRCAVAHDLLSSTDVHRSGGSGLGSIDFSAPSATAAIHLLCRVELKPDLSFSTREIFDAQYRKTANLGLLQRFAEGLSPKCKSLKFHGALSSEIIPQLTWILSAGVGASALCRASSSMDVLTPKERASMQQHVGVLSCLGLTYVADLNQDDDMNNFKRGSSYTDFATNRMRLEPPIDRMVQFGGVTFGSRREIPSALKELISHQVRLLKIRRAPEESSSPSSPSRDSTASRKLKQALKAKTPSSPAVPEPKESLFSSTKKTISPTKIEDLAMSITAPKRSKPSPAAVAGAANNFLGLGAKRARESKSARKAAAVGLERSSKKKKVAHTGSGMLLHQVVRLRYVKGFTQAVHTPCSLKDLV